MNRRCSPPFYLLLIMAVACSPLSRTVLNKKLKQFERTHHHRTGLVVYDPEKEKIRYQYNGGLYFTPASNTKILTLYASLKILGDKVPALKYIEKGDSLIFWGTGDPTFLNPDFPPSGALEFLLGRSSGLYFSASNFLDQRFGPGWAWDDYHYLYSLEKSPLPLYGNYFTVRKDSGEMWLRVNPRHFKNFLWLGDSIEGGQAIERNTASNQADYNPLVNETSFLQEIPFSFTDDLSVQLLSDTLGRKVTAIKRHLTPDASVFIGLPTDTLYKKMMQDSDNFVAEQLLLMCASVLSDSLNTEIAIDHVKERYFRAMPDEPVWKDGSGLSRYNLFTPRFITALWEMLYRENEESVLFPLLAVGGRRGTLRNWYKGEVPYIYGKTGTLSNNHCLSGFLKTKKGKTLIFSFMNNNYPGTSGPIKMEMEQILREIHLKY